MAMLLPDPCDADCPDVFKQKARDILVEVCQSAENDTELRHALIDFVADFADWDVSAHSTYLPVAHSLIRSAHGAEPTLVVDPFAGGVPFRWRLCARDCEAFATDLNPVSCLTLQIMSAERRAIHEIS